MAPGALGSIYEQLPALADHELRLLWLHPGQSGNIVCDLTVAPLTEQYEALSYTRSPIESSQNEWEDIDDAAEKLDQLAIEDTQIQVNGHALDVPPNLFVALQHLRLTSEKRAIWVDFVCVNQDDVQDRNAQVARMDQIYRSAQKVVIWLGLESNDCDQAVGELLGLAANLHLSMVYPAGIEATRTRIGPIASLLGRPWFSRVWVVQEVALAKEAIVQIGSRTVPWEWFLRAARVYREHLACCAAVMQPLNDSHEDDEFLALKNGLANVLALDGEALRGLTLHAALRLFHGRQSTDPRDKVYALLGLLKPKERLVTTDYGLTAREVYEETALGIIRTTQSLAVLMDTDEYAGDVETASWAPDWTTGNVTESELYEHFRAAGNLRADAARCSAHTLRASGLIVDTITKVAPDSGDNDELLAAAAGLKAWEKLTVSDVDGPSSYASGSARKEAFWQTVLMGRSAADRSRRVQTTDQDQYQAWRQWLTKYTAAKKKARAALLQTASSNVGAHNAVLCAYPETRRFFLTEDGYFGLGPVEIEEDDVVCVLAGGQMPFILRPIDETCDVCDNDQLCYRLMGFAYVHGIMDGETVRGIEADEEEPIHFCIR